MKPLEKVTINNLFARAILECRVKGQVFVDNVNNPETFYVVHPYGMSLLFGNHNNSDFNQSLRDYCLNVNGIRVKTEWMQAFPDSWDNVLKGLFKENMIKSSENTENRDKGIIELNTRVNFKFNQKKYFEFRKLQLNADYLIVRSTKQIFNDMKGSVIPSLFWDSADDFVEKGVGFSLFFDNKLSCTVYSAFIHDNKLEFGIETIAEFRGKGFAQYTSSTLIDYCIENNYEPVWACRLENTGSYKLAQKLGFEPTLYIPYYRLSN
jgi:GNAT superfamily N-acetyltransferase